MLLIWGLGFVFIPPFQVDKNAEHLRPFCLIDSSSISELFSICELHGTQEGFAHVLFYCSVAAKIAPA